MAESPIEALANLDRARLEEVVDQLGEDHLESLLVSWHDLWARPEQLAPEGIWRFWAIITGRGWGKNRTAAEWTLDRCEVFAQHQAPHLIGLFGRTDDEVHQLMLGGESGLVRCAEKRGWRVESAASNRFPRIYVPLPDGSEHMSQCEVHSGGEPDRARGRNFHTVWADEFASWKHVIDAEGNTTFTNMNFGLRAICPGGLIPQGVVTTTPKPIPVVRELLDGKHGPVAVSRGSLTDNLTNLDPSFVKAIVDAYAGTRMEQQELHGQILESVEGALWDQSLIHRWRIRGWDTLPRLGHIVIGVDPSGSDKGDECGIVACGKAAELDGKERAHGYVLEDRSVRNRPAVWGPEVVKLFWEMAEAFPNVRCEVVFEINYGGQMGIDTIKVRDPSVPVDQVTATRAKRVRAEPVAALYDQGRWHHVGVFPQLEEQMCWWTPLEPTSPDRMDALVWSVSKLLPELMVAPGAYAKGFSDLLA
jgi:phage terminase large subunit-like protein